MPTAWDRLIYRLENFWASTLTRLDEFPAFATVLILLLAAGVLAWAWWGEAIALAFRRRAFWRVPRRCPKCWYDMSGTEGIGDRPSAIGQRQWNTSATSPTPGERSMSVSESGEGGASHQTPSVSRDPTGPLDSSPFGKGGAGTICPECGRRARTERELRRRRRHPWLAALALLLLCAGVAHLGWLRWGHGRWIIRQPTDWIITHAPTMPEWQTTKYPWWYHHVLIDRSLKGEFTDAQWKAAIENTAFAVARPRAAAGDPVTIDLDEVYWMTFFTIDVEPVHEPAARVRIGVNGYTGVTANSRSVTMSGPMVITCTPPPEGETVRLRLTIYESNVSLVGDIAWEGTIDVPAPVDPSMTTPAANPAAPNAPGRPIQLPPDTEAKAAESSQDTP